MSGALLGLGGGLLAARVASTQAAWPNQPLQIVVPFPSGALADLPASDLPVWDPAALAALLRAKPDGYSYGSPGIGTAHHFLVELITAREGAKATHVPYRGSAKALLDLAEGRLDFMFLDASVALPQITGKIKALAVTGSRRAGAHRVLSRARFTGLAVDRGARRHAAVIADKLNAALTKR